MSQPAVVDVPGQAPGDCVPQQHAGHLHAPQPDFLPHVLPIVTSALTNPELSMVATIALNLRTYQFHEVIMEQVSLNAHILF